MLLFGADPNPAALFAAEDIYKLASGAIGTIILGMLAMFAKRFLNKARVALLGTCVACAAFVGLGAVRLHASKTFDARCSAYLNSALASDDPVVQEKHYGLALKYLDDNGLNKGSSALLYSAPEDDVESWYRALKETHDKMITAQQAHELRDKLVMAGDPTTEQAAVINSLASKASVFDWKAELIRRDIVKPAKEGEPRRLKYPSGVSFAPHLSQWYLGMGATILSLFVAGMMLGRQPASKLFGGAKEA